MTLSVPPLLHEPTAASTRKRPVAFVAALLAVAVLATTLSWWWSSGASETTAAAGSATVTVETNPLARAPAGVRVRVRVVNTTDINGLAKRATALLRDHGFDVVEYVSDRRKPRPATLVQTHTGHDDWSDRVLLVLGAGATEASADSSHFVDITVLLGQDWKAPPQSFRP